MTCASSSASYTLFSILTFLLKQHFISEIVDIEGF